LSVCFFFQKSFSSGHKERLAGSPFPPSGSVALRCSPKVPPRFPFSSGRSEDVVDLLPFLLPSRQGTFPLGRRLGVRCTRDTSSWFPLQKKSTSLFSSVFDMMAGMSDSPEDSLLAHQTLSPCLLRCLFFPLKR